MNEVLIVKWLHVLSSTLLFGTGIGTAFYLFFVSRTRDTHAVAVVSKYVVIADWFFTATTIVFQPVSGFWLARLMGYPLTSRWILWSTALFLLAALCWLPVVWLQVRMRNLAQAAARDAAPLPAAYWRCFRWWTALGIPALFAFLAIYWLMVAKPFDLPPLPHAGTAG